MKPTKLVVMISVLALLAGCSNMLEPPEAPPARTGTVTFTVGQGGERTLFPSLSQFTGGVRLHFDTLDGGSVEDVEVAGGTVTLSLPEGEWNVVANAYRGNVLAAQSFPHNLKWDLSTDVFTGDTHFVLEPADPSGMGTLKGVVAFPEGIAPGAGSRIVITELSSNTPVYDQPVTGGMDSEETMPQGRYFVDLVLEDGDGGPVAVCQRTVVILSGLVTELRFEPGAAEFLSGETRAPLTVVENLVFGPTADNTAGIDVDTEDFGNSNIAITAPNGTNPVYFTLANPDGLDLIPEGAVLETGADGSVSGAELSVFSVDTSAAALDGGVIPLALTALKPGREGAQINITVTVRGRRTPEVQFGQTSNSDDVVVNPPDGGPDDAEVNMGISAVEKNGVYFMAYKAANQTIAPSGADSGKVTVHTTGIVDGETASDTVAVIAVNTRSLVFDGGSLAFTLEVTDDTGAVPRAVHITLDLAANRTGAAVFRVDWDDAPATLYQDLDLASAPADLVRIGPAAPDGTPGAFAGLQEAMEYVDRNTTADTDYLIRVEKDELDLPRFYITACKQENVTIRLRGYGQERTLQNNNDGPYTTAAGVSFNSAFLTFSNVGSNPQAQDGFFTIGWNATGFWQKITFILENNITVKGVGSGQAQSVSYQSLLKAAPNATLVMKKGSKLTEHVCTYGALVNVYSVIYADVRYPDRLEYGWVRLEGGSITNCSFTAASIGLIFFNGFEDEYAPGAFYKAESTENNPIVISGNTNNMVVWYSILDNVDGYHYDIGSESGVISIP